MKVKDLEGIETIWKLSTKTVNNKRPTSNLHQIAKLLLRKKYPNIQFHEEVSIRIDSSQKLYLDFYIPQFQMAIEVNGQQHYAYSTMFHKNRMQFLTSKANDAKKAMWCEINGIDLIILKYNEVEQWDKQL